MRRKARGREERLSAALASKTTQLREAVDLLAAKEEEVRQVFPFQRVSPFEAFSSQTTPVSSVSSRASCKQLPRVHGQTKLSFPPSRFSNDGLQRSIGDHPQGFPALPTFQVCYHVHHKSSFERLLSFCFFSNAEGLLSDGLRGATGKDSGSHPGQVQGAGPLR